MGGVSAGTDVAAGDYLESPVASKLGTRVALPTAVKMMSNVHLFVPYKYKNACSVQVQKCFFDNGAVKWTKIPYEY